MERRTVGVPDASTVLVTVQVVVLLRSTGGIVVGHVGVQLFPDFVVGVRNKLGIR